MDDMEAISRLHALAMHAVGMTNLEPILGEICETAVALSSADFGHLQLVDATSGDLRIVAQHGFPDWWAAFWNDADPGQDRCGSALALGRRVVVEDVLADPQSGAPPDREALRRAGVHALQSTPLLTRSGKVVGVVSTHFRQPQPLQEHALRWLDLLARQAADLIDCAHTSAELRASESRLRALVSASADIVFRLSANGTQVRILERDGVSSAALAQPQPWPQNCVDPADQPQVCEAMTRAIDARAPFDQVYRGADAGGQPRWLHTRAVPLLGAGGQILEWFGAATDVTASKAAARALAEEQQRLSALLEALPVGVAFTNSPDCEHVTGNSALLAQFGASAQDNVSASASSPEQYGRQIIYLREGHPVEAADLPLQQAARAGRVIAPVELLVRLPSGQERILEVSGAPIRDSEGQVIGAVTVSMDIGERKRAAQEREQARAKDAFLAVLGHELRNPLAAIATAVAALQREATAGGPGAMARVIDHQVEVLRRLVDDLLDISRLRQGVGRLQPGPVALRTLLQDAAATVLAATTAQSQQLVVDPPPEEVHFQADRVRLQQVLANLLDNASKYGGPGCRIVLSGRREGDMVVLRCRDNGPGIAPEMQPRVFDPLVRLEPAGQQAPQGLGLGLALARQLVELHGGTIDLVSDGPGTGCEFLVRIPLVAVEASPRAADEPPGPACRMGPVRTLLVDDHAELAQATAQLLRSEGLEVVTAADADQAAAAATQLAPELLLCDLTLPGDDGLALINRLRPQLTAWHTRVVVMTALSEREIQVYARRARDLGVDEFIAKPVTLAWLTDLLARLRPG